MIGFNPLVKRDRSRIQRVEEVYQDSQVVAIGNSSINKDDPTGSYWSVQLSNCNRPMDIINYRLEALSDQGYKIDFVFVDAFNMIQTYWDPIVEFLAAQLVEVRIRMIVIMITYGINIYLNLL